MAGSPGSGFKAPRANSENDIYTALVIIAFVFVLGAAIFTIVRSIELFGTAFPGFA